MLTRYVKALCPQQAIDKYTPDAWHDVLGEFGADECRAAVIAVTSRQPFVAPSEIIAEVEREHRAELGRQRVAALAAGRPLVQTGNGTVVVGPQPIAELSRHAKENP